MSADSAQIQQNILNDLSSIIGNKQMLHSNYERKLFALGSANMVTAIS